MLEHLLQLIVLFTVIFDPLASFIIFYAATSNMSRYERMRTATIAVLVAAIVSYLVLLFGQTILSLFNTTITEFQVAGGLVLGILGIRMVLGFSFTNLKEKKNNSGAAIASIIGTPLLTGPAAITGIIISTSDFGKGVTALAIGIVLLCTVLLFYNAERMHRLMGRTTVQVISTVLGLITLAWGVKYVLLGLGL